MEQMDKNDPIGQDHVDTSRPFSSVKEAVAIFGQRIILPGQTPTVNRKPVSPSISKNTKPVSSIASPSISQNAKPVSSIASPSITKNAKPVSSIDSTSVSKSANPVSSIASTSVSQNAKPASSVASTGISQTTSSSTSPWKQCYSVPSSPQGLREDFMEVLKKLEAEIMETKTELKMLKKRESETEVALATLNAELHKNMSKMAKAEADAAGKRAEAMAKSVSFKETKEMENGEERRKELTRRIQKEYPSLAQILDSNKGDIDGYFAKTTKKKKKKKPIIPLVGDFFFCKKKGSSIDISGPLYATSTLHF